MKKRKASCSERSGFSTSRPSEHVDGRVHEYPHHVDEVPVDPGHLDASVLLRAEMPAEGADRGESEQREPDEHMRSVEAGEPVEDRALRVLLNGEADVEVLVDLNREEGEAE